VQGARDLLGVARIQRLHDLDAEAGTVREEHRKMWH
jgi:hypothetical protein